MVAVGGSAWPTVLGGGGGPGTKAVGTIELVPIELFVRIIGGT